MPTEDNPAAIVAGAALTLDFTRPIAVILPSTLTFIDSTKRAAEVVSELMAAAPSGSYLTLYHLASDLDPALLTAVGQWNRMSAQPVTPRSRAELGLLTAGLELVPPGLVPVTEWRPVPASPTPRRSSPSTACSRRSPSGFRVRRDRLSCSGGNANRRPAPRAFGND